MRPNATFSGYLLVNANIFVSDGEEGDYDCVLDATFGG
jgi:hypothetical protein